MSTECSFYQFRSRDSTFIHDLGVIDAYLFPVSGVPDEVLRAASNATDPLTLSFSLSIIDAALYFRTHPSLLSTLTLSIFSSSASPSGGTAGATDQGSSAASSSGDDSPARRMRAAQQAAFSQLIELVGRDTHLGQLLADYAAMHSGAGGLSFSPYLRDALALELEKQLRQPAFRENFGAGQRAVEMEYERRMMAVMLEGTAGKRELQTPFLMMAAAMKSVHERDGIKDRIPQGYSLQGSQLNATTPHNDVEASLKNTQ